MWLENGVMENMISSNAIIDNDKVKQIIMNLYGISEPLSCTFIRRSFNDHYLIQTNSEKYILRVYLNNKYYINDINDFKFELELLTFLASRNIPVSYPIKNNDNLFISKVLHNNETRLITLFSFAEGTPINTTLERNLALRFGESIARLHKTLNEYKGDYQRYRISLDYLIDEPVEMLQEYSSKHALGDLGFFTPYAKYLYNQLQELPFNDESYGIIHGDLNPSNIHLDNNREIKIFDFDHCGYGWRIHDLAVIKLCFEKTTYENILDGYLSRKSLSETEIRLIGIYSKTLIIRKYKDVLSMLKVSRNAISNNFDEKAYIESAISTLHNLMEI
jgi:Ser/Thr protein kinase RdoA (MazF antagonist)